MSVEEQLAIFLKIVGENASNRMAEERFQRSGDTISRAFNKVLDAMVELYTAIAKQPDANQPIPPPIRNNPKMFPSKIASVQQTVPISMPVCQTEIKYDIETAKETSARTSLECAPLTNCYAMFCLVGKDRHTIVACFKLLWVMTLFRCLAATI